MKTAKTRDWLWILWDSEEGTEEREGFTLWAYWPQKPKLYPRFPLGLWPKGAEWNELEYRSDDESAAWRMNYYTVKIENWPKPEDWKKVLKQTFQAMIDGGATVVWCDCDHYEPAATVFDPAHMSGKVWAAMDKSGRFFCSADLDGTLDPLPDEQMAELRRFL